MSTREPVRALNLDAHQQDVFVQYYRSLPEKSASTVRFFNHGEFYTVHDEDTTLIATITFGMIKLMGREPKLKYLCLNKNEFDNVIRELLLVKHYRIEVYVKSQSSRNDWILEYKASPGNLEQFEDILFDDNKIVLNSSVMAVKIGKSMNLGVSCVNTTENTLSVTEFMDNEFFTELEAFVAQLNPKECIISLGEAVETINLGKMLERNGVLVVKVKKSEFASVNIAQDLNRLLFFAEKELRNSSVLKEFKYTQAMDSLQAAINYLNLTGDDQNFNQFRLSSLDICKYVRLDQNAVRALNLLPAAGIVNKFDTVYGILNSCCTQQGRRLLDRWIRQPLRDINLISERLDVVECLIVDSEARNTLATYYLNKTPDLLLLSKKLGKKKATLSDCYRVYQTVGSVTAIVKTLEQINNKSVKALLVDPLIDILGDLDKYQSMIELMIDLDLVNRGEFFIKPSYQPDLQELHNQKQEIEEKMQKELSKTARELGLEPGSKIKLETTDQHGYFFRVPVSEESTLGKNKNYTIIATIKAGIRFNTSKLRDLNKTYSEINESYSENQKNVVEEIINVAAGYSDVLRNLNLTIATIDVLVAFANAAVNAPIPYVRPKMLPMGSGVLKLKMARHPCIEKQDGVSIIPNNVEFRRDEKIFHIITGPNMGGKSTFMRSVGVCVVLAHMGCFVPCEDAEISVVDCILTRVGADDCELKGMSTFMMEMVEANSITRSSTSNSFVIVDELGRGTSTYDGCGMAWAIAKYLAETVKCFTLFATHYHEIITLEETVDAVGNLHVSAIITDERVTPLYQVTEGPCDKSYGIQCARLAGFPNDVLEFAKQYLEELEHSNGMKYISDFDVTLKRAIVEEGDAQIAKLLEEIKGKDENSEEVQLKLKEFKNRAESGNNLFLKGLIEKI